MYKEFADLCEEKDVTPYRVAKDCGFSNVTLSDWKNGKSTPNADKLVKIARYLDTTVEYLVTGESQPAAPSSFRLSDFEKELVVAYRRTDEAIKTSVRKLLDIDDAELPKKEKAV